MKKIVNDIPSWPSKLSKLKGLCTFLRVRQWKKVILRRDAGSTPDLQKNLKPFRAKFLKWRYETLYECFSQLFPLRYFCEHVLSVNIRIWFPTFRDGALLDIVTSALEDKELWVFIKCFHFRVFQPLEWGRRWGSVCICCEHLRQLFPFKRTKCEMNSRRLRQARKFIAALVEELFWV